MRFALLQAIVIFCFVVQPTIAQDRESMTATLFSWTGERERLGELDSIATDRPDFTEASSTVGLGVAQIESGYTFTKSTGVESHSWGEPLLRYGVFANWLELRMALAPVSERAVTTQSGVEDLYLGAKLGLTQQQGWLPEVAVVPQMTVPTGSSAFTTNRTLPGVNFLYGWDVTEKFSFAGSTQYNRSVDDTASSYDEWAQSLTVGRSIGESTGSYFEWFALFPEGGISAATEHYINGGLTYQWSDDLQSDFRIGKGLSDASADYFVGAGLSMRFR